MDENIRKVLSLFMKKWKTIVAFALIGVLAAYVITANFTTLTYTSTIGFYAYVQDEEREDASGIVLSSSNTSKMNYAIRMITTYLALIDTNNFYQIATDSLNKSLDSDYDVSFVKNSMKTQATEDTALFSVSITTEDSELSYKVANELAKVIPNFIEKSNDGLVKIKVIDKPIKAAAAESLNYPQKCLIGAAVGIVIACAYIFLRDMLDIRIRTSNELVERYDIPVLGSIPDFDSKSKKSSKKMKTYEGGDN